MPIFKYTVANKDGKKLSGTVEAPDEKTARSELNNLGFSILILQETNQLPPTDQNLTKFVFEAIDKNSQLVNGTIPANNEDEAFEKLHSEYALNVTAIWQENSTEEQINSAKRVWSQKLQKELSQIDSELQASLEKSLEEQKEEAFFKAKIEKILAEVNQLLTEFDQEFQGDQKAEIHKKIDKLLRIKHSTNTQYILASAEDLLEFIKSQEQVLKEQGHADKRLDLQIKTNKLLEELKRSSKPKTISEDILEKIENWEKSHPANTQDAPVTTKFISKILQKIKNIFVTRPEIAVIKDQIKAYNKQLWEFTKLYFKEPTPEYKTKVKNSIKTIWKARQKAIHSLKQAKKLLKNRSKEPNIPSENVLYSFIEEVNSLTGWLLTFYIIYYFTTLYLNTKDFGLSKIPSGFIFYESQLFKYILAILFLLHISTAIKVNYFRKNIIASIVLPIFFVFSSILVILNF